MALIAYIDKGLVIDRLNTVVGLDWSDTYTQLDGPFMLCRLTVLDRTREDVGEFGSLKGRYSDALKRAAVKFGVGVTLARIPQSRLMTSDDTCTGWQRGNKTGIDLTQTGLDYLRGRYGDWLEKVGIAAYGDPLASGDLGDSQGDDVDELPPARPGLSAGSGDGISFGYDLPPDVEAVIARAAVLGHRGYQRGAVELQVSGRESCGRRRMGCRRNRRARLSRGAMIGERGTCPMCGRVCALRRRGQIRRHYVNRPAQGRCDAVRRIRATRPQLRATCKGTRVRRSTILTVRPRRRRFFSAPRSSVGRSRRPDCRRLSTCPRRLGRLQRHRKGLSMKSSRSRAWSQ